MPLLTQKHKGSRITARDTNALSQAAGALLSATAGAGLHMSVGMSGLAFGLDPESVMPEGCTFAQHTTAATAIAFGLVYFNGTLETGYSDPLPTCIRPDYSGRSAIGITLYGVGRDGVVIVRTRGITPVLYDNSKTPSGLTVAAGGRLGCLRGSYYAQYDVLGPLEVVGVVGEITANIGVAIVNITGTRGDNIIVVAGESATDGVVAEAIEWGDNFALAVESFGYTVVTSA